MRRIQLRSPPAEKAAPAPVRTTARTAGSAPKARNASVSSRITASSNAFRRSGRLRVSVATPRASVARWRFMASHSEHAEPGRLDRGVEARRERQREDAAGLARIDHAIVPEPRAGIIGMALGLVLRADRRLEGLLFGRAPGAAARLDIVAAHGGEHGRGLLPAHYRDARVGPHEEEARA